MKRVGHSDFQWPDPPDQKETSALYLIQNDITTYMSTPSDAHLYNLLEKSIKSIRNP